MNLARSILLFIILLSVAGAGSLPAQDPPQTYPVKRGARPPVALHELNAEAWEPGKIYIKLRPGSAPAETLMQKLLEPGRGPDDFSLGFTDSKQLDSLHHIYGISRYTPLLYPYYAASPAARALAPRHKAWDMNCWMSVQMADTANILRAVADFLQLDEIEAAEPVYRIVHMADHTAWPEQTTQDASAGGTAGRLRNPWLPDDTFFGAQWALQNTGQSGGTAGADMQMPRAWSLEKGHPEVIVAVIDGGIQTDHPDLAANMWSGVGYNFADNQPGIVPHIHGTHVGGIIGAVSNNQEGVAGVAGGSGESDGVRLMSCQVFRPDNTSGGFVQAMLFAADNGAAISQNSWIYNVEGVYNAPIIDAIDYFNVNAGGEVLQGGITIFGAGNNQSGGIFYPPHYEGVLAVAATNHDDIMAYYSNFGQHIGISAPGGDTRHQAEAGILSTVLDGGYNYLMGTSMACPQVSGAAALLISYAYRNELLLTPDQIRELLVSNTDDIYVDENLNFDHMLGSGRLNGYQSLRDLHMTSSGLPAPGNFQGQSQGQDAVVLSWTLNAHNHEVLLFASAQPGREHPEQGVNYSPGQYYEGIGTLIYKGNGTAHLHSELEPGTRYYYSLYATNGQLAYSAARSTRISTDCAPFSLPFAEDFSQMRMPPPCWTRLDLDGDGNHWGLRWEPVSNNFVAMSLSRSEVPLNPDNWLITPAIEFTSDNVVLRFKLRSADVFNWNETLSVLVSDQGTDPQHFTPVLTELAGSYEWRSLSLNITGYKDRPVHIAFRHWNSFNVLEIRLDDIQLEVAPTGDVYPDGRIDIQDVVWLLRHLKGDTPAGFAHDRADMNQDGQINEEDLEMLISLIMEEP